MDEQQMGKGVNQEARGLCDCRSLYPIDRRTQYERWADVRALRVEPTVEMAELSIMVKAALDAGLYYSKDVLAAVIEMMGERLTADLIALGRDRVEGGYFGMEVYYARQYLEALARREQVQSAEADLMLEAGRRLGVLMFSDGKQVKSCTVVRWESGIATIKGMRGRYEVTGSYDALTLSKAIRRYQDYRAR